MQVESAEMVPDQVGSHPEKQKTMPAETLEMSQKEADGLEQVAVMPNFDKRTSAEQTVKFNPVSVIDNAQVLRIHSDSQSLKDSEKEEGGVGEKS